MKKKIAIVFGAAALTLAVAVPSVQALSGEQKAACEAKLCLAPGGASQAECQGPLARYYSIKKRKAHQTEKARRDFINKCPTK